MATGFQSNYNDSGYSVPTSGTYYDASGFQIDASSISTSDIYTNSQQVGVYMINGAQVNALAYTNPIFSSLSNMNNASIELAVDDAWLVYPGYGFQLFQNVNYNTDDASSYSRIYINNTSMPVIFSLNNSSSGSYSGIGTTIMTSVGTFYNNNSTRSVKIYFRFQEITITGLS